MTSVALWCIQLYFQSFHWSGKNFMKDHFKTYSELNIDTLKKKLDALDLLQPFEISHLTIPHI